MLLAQLDIDHFKRINDGHGHAAGDRALQAFAGVVRANVRDTDVLARWGGEEFLLAFAGPRDEAVPTRVQRLMDDGRMLHFDLGLDRPLYLTFSVGWTVQRGDDAAGGWVRALELADAALYRAKASGRNTWVGLVAGPRHPPGGTPGAGQRLEDRVAAGELQWLAPPQAR